MKLNEEMAVEVMQIIVDQRNVDYKILRNYVQRVMETEQYSAYDAKELARNLVAQNAGMIRLAMELGVIEKSDKWDLLDDLNAKFNVESVQEEIKNMGGLRYE